MKRLPRGTWLCSTFASMLAVAAHSSSLAQSRGGALAPFTEEAAARGVVFDSVAGVYFGRGVAFVDLDGDGDADIVACGDALGTVALFENDGTGHFINRTMGSGIPILPGSSGVCAADYNRDGKLDLYISVSGSANVLMRNLGNFRFTNVAAAAGVADTSNSQGSAWGDFNLDGWPDLYVSNHLTQANKLYKNNGDGTFTNVASTLIAGGEPTLQSAFIDFDLDGDLDIYVGNDKGASTSCFWSNYLYENQDGSFIDVTDSSGTEACADTMSVTVGDFDGNGWPDIACTNIEPGTVLLMNQGDGTFIDQAAEAGVQDEGFAGWGAAFIDFDNDRLLDLFVCLQDDPNRLYRNSGTWPCVDVAETMNIDTGGRSYVVAVADVDGDGDLDFLLENENAPLRLFINHEGQKRNWARFDVIGQGANRYAIGTRLDARIGTQWQQRFVQAGANYKSQDELLQHFGLGDAAVIEELVIIWPGGDTRTLLDVPANHTWTIYPLDKCGDVNADGVRDFTDYLAFAACYSGSDPTDFAPGCELFDYQGDCDVDLADFDMFLDEYADPLIDCNNNGIPDLREILEGTAPDNDNDGLIDGCVPASDPAPGDVTGDGSVDLADLLAVISTWGCAGCTPDCTGDANDDCEVNLADLLLVISNWGS